MCDQVGRESSKPERWLVPRSHPKPSKVLGGCREGLGSMKLWDGFSGLVTNQITAVKAIICPRCSL